jgi:hypothetical protein
MSQPRVMLDRSEDLGRIPEITSQMTTKDEESRNKHIYKRRKITTTKRKGFNTANNSGDEDGSMF